MFVEYLLGALLVALAAAWLFSPLFLVLLLRRTQNLESDLRILRQDLREAVARLDHADGGTPAGPATRPIAAPVTSRSLFDEERVAAAVHAPPVTPNLAHDAAVRAANPPIPEPTRVPVPVPVPAPPVDEPLLELSAADVSASDTTPASPPPASAPPPPPVVPVPASPLPAAADGDVAGEPATARGWEERIGGHWLNKLGGLLLVIGLTLFVGYSLQQLGPHGRLALGAVVSLGLLVGGIVAERWQAYRTLAVSLIATGWAGLYITAYAAHGIAASRVIENPALAMGVLVAVAAGMVGHSLTYRLPLVTALAYVFGFIGIVISPVGLWSTAACLLLAVSLLVVAFRYAWDEVAVLGLICTYSTLAVRATEMLDATLLWQGFTAGHVVVGIAWLAFEAYDVAVVARGPRPGAGRAVMPLNLCCMLGLAVSLWPVTVEISWLSCGVAGLYVVSMLARLIVRPPAAFGEDASLIERLILGGYEAAVTVAAAAAAVAIWQRFQDDAAWLVVLLTLEAELLFLVGFFTRQRFLRQLALPLFAGCLVNLPRASLDLRGWWPASLPVPLTWVPHAVGMAAVFAVNRGLAYLRDRRPTHSLDSLFSYVSAGLVVAVVMAESTVGGLGLASHHLGMAGIVMAWLVLQIALSLDLDELFMQSRIIGIGAGIATVVTNGLLLEEVPLGLREGVEPVDAWGWLAPAAALCGVAGWQLSRRTLPDRLALVLRRDQAVAVGACIWLSVLFAWHLLPASAVAVAWMIMGMAILAIGERVAEPALRQQGHLLCGFVAVRLFMANFTSYGTTAGVSHRLLTVTPIAAAFAYLAWSARSLHVHAEQRTRETQIARFYTHVATVAVAVLMRFELGRVLTLPAWSVFGVGLVAAGWRLKSPDLRVQSMVLAAICFARSWATHFFIPEGTLGDLGPVVIGAVVIASLFACMFLSPRSAGATTGFESLSALLDARARAVFCSAGTVLLAVLLYHEVPWRAITAAWGIEGALLLVAGFALRERLLRLAGLAVLGICVPKLFFYDLRNLDTPARIVSFVLLGALLLAASWVYTRFRGQFRELLEEPKP